jgi:hypothetical protein
MNKKETYEAPAMLVVEIKTEGRILIGERSQLIPEEW